MHQSDCNDGPTLLREQLGLSPEEIQLLQRYPGSKGNSILGKSSMVPRQGCWMDRRVDSVVILVVDALRFDFCLYNLPKSVGSRLQKLQQPDSLTFPAQQNHTRLFRFVADPPTVTMQRLKALTTGGLPTFADISANFGGASVDEDSWIQQLLVRERVDKDDISSLVSNHLARGLKERTKAGFVGDDTWEDLYPGFFSPSYPYPSFNTRDLETVDNGCFKHIPYLIKNLRRAPEDLGESVTENKEDLEVVVVHFLGVDHVGHTYGPHNEHMDRKLRQMDDALSTVLDTLDDEKHSKSCHAAFIFGDHGMTEDGNHGGGTNEEISAALFVHTSPGCGDMSHAVALEFGDESSTFWSSDSSANYREGFSPIYASIHQIDLVPTLSMLLGLPIPFANLGGMVPSLVPGQSPEESATALALNAAQVWRYLTVYSETANKLPNLMDLKRHLDTAVTAYKEALSDLELKSGESRDSESEDRFFQSSLLFKVFLSKALELGQRVWTRFDFIGMVSGIVVLALALGAYTFPLTKNIYREVINLITPSKDHEAVGGFLKDRYWEFGLAILFMVFQCGLLTFSNSYILEEENTITFFLTIICFGIALRLRKTGVPSGMSSWAMVLLIPVASRLSELYLSGHGLDPSIQLHLPHVPGVFLLSLFILGWIRWSLFRSRVTRSRIHVLVDCLCLVSLAESWCEKRSGDPALSGYTGCRAAIAMLVIGMTVSICQTLLASQTIQGDKALISARRDLVVASIAKLLIAVMIVTGPSTASTLVLYALQMSILFVLSNARESLETNPLVLAALCKMITRHVFFATNHGCAFNRLQYSAAFVATKEFYFVSGGISLFLNTFGWEVAGLAFAWMFSQCTGQNRVWRIYSCFQMLEALTSCISVSVLRRHLMVWDIYAPHFLFVAIFTVLNGLSQITITVLSLV